MLIDGICSGWLVPAIWGYKILWKLPCLLLFPTTLILLLLGHWRHTMPMPQGLCTSCFFLTLTSWQKFLAPFLTPFISLFKYYLLRQTVSDHSLLGDSTCAKHFLLTLFYFSLQYIPSLPQTLQTYVFAFFHYGPSIRMWQPQGVQVLSMLNKHSYLVIGEFNPQDLEPWLYAESPQ